MSVIDVLYGAYEAWCRQPGVGAEMRNKALGALRASIVESSGEGAPLCSVSALLGVEASNNIQDVLVRLSSSQSSRP